MADADLAAISATNVPPATSARYVYLMTRLRTKQITMEEATELFSLQQGLLNAARAAAARAPAASATTASRLAGVPTLPMPMALSDDTLWTGLLFAGAGAGLLAAVLRRATEGPKPAESGRPS
ncbi:MAG: hypothetical protein L3J87_04215 [Thermoplasmata archaeon]|nr:hypothetical protein [Thermoplasmata archaeon]MCI4344810.1 hypothetical protein [Thermoplasmata archaeon]